MALYGDKTRYLLSVYNWKRINVKKEWETAAKRVVKEISIQMALISIVSQLYNILMLLDLSTASVWFDAAIKLELHTNDQMKWSN